MIASGMRGQWPLTQSFATGSHEPMPAHSVAFGARSWQAKELQNANLKGAPETLYPQPPPSMYRKYRTTSRDVWKMHIASLFQNPMLG